MKSFTVVDKITSSIIKEEKKLKMYSKNEIEQYDICKLFEKTAEFVESKEESDDEVFKNAKITIYDSCDHEYIIRSGDGQSKFLVNSEGNNVKVITLVTTKSSSYQHFCSVM